MNGDCDQGNAEDTGSAARSTADGLRQLVASSRGIAATMPAGSTVSPNDVLDAAGDILDKSANLLAAAKTAVADPDNPNSRAQLTQVLMTFSCHVHAITFVRCHHIDLLATEFQYQLSLISFLLLASGLALEEKNLQ